MIIIDFLCRACAWIAVFLLNVLGMDFQCDGVYLVAGSKEFAYTVIPECCGVKSMLLLSGLSIYWGLYELKKKRHVVWLALLSLPVAFGANLLRVVSVAAAMYFYGGPASDVVHFVSAFATFPLALAAMFCLTRKFTKGEGVSISWFLRN